MLELPEERVSFIHKFKIQNVKGLLIVGLFDNGMPCEIQIKIAKEGSTLSGLIRAFSQSVSLNLQAGIELKDLCKIFSGMKFEPNGYSTNVDVGYACSIFDYIFRYLELKFYGSISPQEESDLF